MAGQVLAVIVGTAAAIVSGITVAGVWTTAAAAFAGGVLTTMIVYAMSRARGRTEVVMLVLTGTPLVVPRR